VRPSQSALEAIDVKSVNQIQLRAGCRAFRGPPGRARRSTDGIPRRFLSIGINGFAPPGLVQEASFRNFRLCGRCGAGERRQGRAGACGAGEFRQWHDLRARPGLVRIGHHGNGGVPQGPIRRPDRLNDESDQVFARQWPNGSATHVSIEEPTSLMGRCQPGPAATVRCLRSKAVKPRVQPSGQSHCGVPQSRSAWSAALQRRSLAPYVWSPHRRRP
jgi:hypothetical protein